MIDLSPASGGGRPDWIALADALPRLWRAYQPFGPQVPDPSAPDLVKNAILSGQVPVRATGTSSLGIERIDGLLARGGDAAVDLVTGSVRMAGRFVPGRPSEHLAARTFSRAEVDWSALWPYIVRNLLPAGSKHLEALPVAATGPSEEPQTRKQSARKAATRERDEALQRRAEAVWLGNPTWTKRLVAEALHAAEPPSDRRSHDGGRALSVDRIVRVIERPK